MTCPAPIGSDLPLPPREVEAAWLAGIHKESTRRAYDHSVSRYCRDLRISRDDALRSLMEPDISEAEDKWKAACPTDQAPATVASRVGAYRSFARHVQDGVEWGYLLRGPGGVYLDPDRHYLDDPPWYHLHSIEDLRHWVAAALLCEGYSLQDVVALQGEDYDYEASTLQGHPIHAALVEMIRDLHPEPHLPILRKLRSDSPLTTRSLSTELHDISRHLGVRLPQSPTGSSKLRAIHAAYARA